MLRTSQGSRPKLQRFFCDHPASAGETYLGHLAQAWVFGVRMIACGMACLVHALVPEAFTSTGSNTVRDLYRSMVVNRQELGSRQ